MQTTELTEAKESKLKKFLDTSFAPLEKFRDEAPGTYKHCQNVAGMCEAISNALNMDSDLIICAALYHDIGKMAYPLAFSENQNGSGNIHNEIDPLLSYHIITRHVGDGVNILLDIKDMPREVIEIVSQHHGSTVLRMFMNKAKSTNVSEWRYKCRPPQTTEAAILMIADSVEATARSYYGNGKLNTDEERKDLVSSTIERLIDDGQLDEMKIGIVKVIKRILNKELGNMFHKREVYPDDEDSLKIKDEDEEKEK